MRFGLKLWRQKLWKECEIEKPTKNVDNISRIVKGSAPYKQGEAGEQKCGEPSVITLGGSEE